jgi:hypothetical protein
MIIQQQAAGGFAAASRFAINFHHFFQGQRVPISVIAEKTR